MSMYTIVKCNQPACGQTVQIEASEAMDQKKLAKRLEGWYLLFLTMPPQQDGACYFCSAACLKAWADDEAMLEAKEQAQEAKDNG